MDLLTEAFNHRELATIIWGFVLFCWGLSQREIRASIIAVVKAVFAYKILITLLILVGHISALVYAVYLLGFWSPGILKTAVAWFFGVGIALLIKINSAQDDVHFFRNVVVSNLRFIVVFEFIVNLYSFPFIVEFLLVPVMLWVVVVKAFSEHDNKYKSVDKIFGFIISSVGAVVLCFSLYSLFLDFRSFATPKNLLAFAWPLVFTLFHVPFIYMVALVAKYEVVFYQLSLFNTDVSLVRSAKIAVLCHFNLNLRGLSKWSKRIGTPRFDCKDDILILLND